MQQQWEVTVHFVGREKMKNMIYLVLGDNLVKIIIYHSVNDNSLRQLTPIKW